MPDYRARTAVLQREARKDWFKIENKAGSADLYIFDEIGFFGTSAQQFTSALVALDTPKINVHLNSPGGEVFDSIAIRNAIRDHPAKVTVTVDGVAASSASFIATAGDEVVMNQHSELMIHDAFGLVVGNAEDMTDMAKRLTQVSDNIAAMYAEKAGGTTEDWRAVMRAETWYSAQEAVDAGLADRVAEADASEPTNRFDLSIFNYAGREKAPTPPPPIETKTPAATVSGPTEQKEQGMSDKLVDSLRQRLGIADENTDEDAILSALDKRLAEVKADPVPSPQNSMDLKDLQRIAESSGAVIMDKGVWEENQAKIQQGVEAAQKLKAQERDHVIAQAVEDGRIPPASTKVWADLYDKDPKGTAEVIAKLQKNLIPVAALGYALDGDDNDLGEFARLFPKGA